MNTSIKFDFCGANGCVSHPVSSPVVFHFQQQEGWALSRADSETNEREGERDRERERDDAIINPCLRKLPDEESAVLVRGQHA